MPTGLTDPAVTVQRAAEPVLRAMAGFDQYDQAQVPDLLSTVTERVLRRLRGGHRIDDVGLYAKQTARNVFKDWMGSKRREQEHIGHDIGSGSSSTPLVEHIAASSLTPSAEVVLHEDQRRHAVNIEAALATLTATQRAVFRLRVVEKRSSADVANQLGYKSAAVVDTKMSSIRKQLRSALPESLMDRLGL